MTSKTQIGKMFDKNEITITIEKLLSDDSKMNVEATKSTQSD